MIIRKAKLKDIPYLVNLDKLAQNESEWWGPLRPFEFRKLIKKSSMIFLAQEDKEIIGYVSGIIKENKLYLENLFVKNHFRNRGIAKKLLNHFLKAWSKSKYKDIKLYCPKRLTKFYKKLKFETTIVVMKRKLR